ncbi:MAG: HAMP domain-containing histidine kinase [Clostridia bacterium]|nr:HAMP domain-containing histidine kinase [Clostridia bacterium]
MKLLRNPEIKKSLPWLAGISVAATVCAFIWQIYFGVFTLILCAVFILSYLLFMKKRYERIADLSESINRILHGDNSIDLCQYTEGELGILQSELYKMTVRLREQQQNLQNDKIYLADSIADISHQIRTPLTSINLLMSFLSEPDLTEARRGELVREINDMLDRIDWLVITLMKISKLDAGTVQFKNETLPLSELVSKSVSPVLIPMELRAQELTINVDGEFSGDLAWTSEAIGNIVKNCMEHTPEGGKISVEARETPIYSEIVISDSGSGISKKDLPHIFERFYKGENSSGKSFGIGLALSRMIITKQNGTVKAENRPNGGAVFIVRFYKTTV